MEDTSHSPEFIRVFEQSFRKTIEDIMPHILERAGRIGYVNLGNIDYDIIQTEIDASYSFVLGIFAGTIFFASRAVEMAINKDDRMQEKANNSGLKWLYLRREVLKKAQASGLPVNLLLNQDEVSFNSAPVFVVRRNKVIHGDLEGYKEATGFYHITDFTKAYRLPVAPSEDDAYDQMMKSRKFLIEWGRSGSTHIRSNAGFVSWRDAT